MNLPFSIDLSGKTVAITGAGGIICGEFAKALAVCGAQVALLDINYDAAEKIASEIGENAIAIRCNCLDKESIKSAYSTIIGAFGKVDILINGAGGNNPKATCDNETMSPEMLETEGLKDFFALDESGRIQLHRMACRSFCPVQNPLQRNCPGVLRNQSEPCAFI